jgi:predicted DNA binding CopG/RHH family protein
MKKNEKMYMPLDSYEKDLLDAVEESNDFASVPIGEERMALLKSAAKRKIESLETKKQISLKIRESDLSLIKLKAKEVSIPYQNIIQALLHKYATGQIKLEV